MNVRPANMELKWTSGCVRSPAHNISPPYLASSTNIFSQDFIRCLGNDLEVNKEQLVRELGFSDKHQTADELYNWCNSPGSTVFVLISVLGNMGRTDCVHKIEQYIQTQTMQLFVKVEDATREGQPINASPKFHQFITSCEFHLLQALENVLGQDVIYYEIVGPGSWVMWSTPAKELKGQQLTLLYHSQPVPGTRAALCEPGEPDTELKQPALTPNNPAITNDVISNNQTYMKTLACTEMEELKYPSMQVRSNSNNITLSGSLDIEKEIVGYLSADEPMKTHSHTTLDNQNCEVTQDHQTHVKSLTTDKLNTPEYSQGVKNFPEKVLCDDGGCNGSNQDLILHQTLENVPHLSLLGEDSSSLLDVLANMQRVSVHPSLGNKEHQCTTDYPAQVKAPIAGTQNTPEYPQVIKHFPDKLLYKDNETKGNNLDLTIHQDFENIPHLSLLDEDSSSPATNTQRPTLPEEKPHKMNNLNCAADTSVRMSIISQTGPKTFNCETSPTAVISPAQNQKDSYSYSEPQVGNPVNQTPISSPTNMADNERHHSGSSLLDQERNTQNNNLLNVLTGRNFLSNICFNSDDVQIQSIASPLDNDNPLLCENSGILLTPPQKRHRPGHVTPSSPVPAEQQLLSNYQLQHQTLLDVQALKLKQLQIRQLQQQQVPVLQHASTTESDYTKVTESQNHPSRPQQIQHQLHQDDETRQQYQHQLGNYSDLESPGEYIHNLNHLPQELEHQTFHLTQTSQQHNLYSQQLNNQNYSQQESQLSTSLCLKPDTSPFLKSNASPYLICHTPPPGFPEEQAEKINPKICKLQSQDTWSQMSGITSVNQEISSASHFADVQSQDTWPQVSTIISSNQETSPACHFVGKLGHVTKMNTKDYMVMSKPILNEFGNSENKSTVRPHNYPSQFITLQNLEFTDNNFTNHLPHWRFRNHICSESTSGSSGISTDFPAFLQGDPSAVFLREQNLFMTPQPFYPAPPVFDALGRRINASVSHNDESLRYEFGEAIVQRQDGFSSANKGHFCINKSLPSSHFQAVSTSPTLNLDAELLQLDGWCQHENGDTIQHTMEKFQSQDGNYIIWKSRRFKKLIISVSHLNQLFHFRIEEIKFENSDRVVYYLFERGYMSDSLLNLVAHYRQDGIRISMQARGSTKTYIEHIQLRCPLKVKLEMKRKDTSRSK